MEQEEKEKEDRKGVCWACGGGMRRGLHCQLCISGEIKKRRLEEREKEWSKASDEASRLIQASLGQATREREIISELAEKVEQGRRLLALAEERRSLRELAALATSERRRAAESRVAELRQRMAAGEERLRRRQKRREDIHRRWERVSHALARARQDKTREFSTQIFSVLELPQIRESSPTDWSSQTAAELLAATQTTYVEGVGWGKSEEQGRMEYSIAGAETSEGWGREETAALGPSALLLHSLCIINDALVWERPLLLHAFSGSDLSEAQLKTLIFQLHANVADLSLQLGLDHIQGSRPLNSLMRLDQWSVPVDLHFVPRRIPWPLLQSLNAILPSEWSVKAEEANAPATPEGESVWEEVNFSAIPSSGDLAAAEAAASRSTLGNLFSVATSSVHSLFAKAPPS